MSEGKENGQSKQESTGLDKVLEDFVLAAINEGVRFGGKQVSDDHWRERVKICMACDKAGTVEIPLPGKTIKTDGCTECGCPFLTKPTWEEYFSWRELRVKKATCPHPTEGNKWQELDNRFLNQIQNNGNE